MSKKDFSLWHSQKAIVNNEKKRPFFHEREVWFCIIGQNVGYEQDGSGDIFLRPVVVLKKFNNEIFWAIPLTTKSKEGKYYFSFRLGAHDPSTAILSQVRLVDAKRLQYKMGDITKDDFKELKAKIRQLLV
jgi:mRNA interferase MazF